MALYHGAARRHSIVTVGYHQRPPYSLRDDISKPVSEITHGVVVVGIDAHVFPDEFILPTRLGPNCIDQGDDYIEWASGQAQMCPSCVRQQFKRRSVANAVRLAPQPMVMLGVLSGGAAT